MRSLKLTSAFTAVAVMALAVPAAAAARAHHHGAARHGVKVRPVPADPERGAASGDERRNRARLRAGLVPAAAPKQARPSRSMSTRRRPPGYSVAGTATTDSHGFYQLTTPALTQNSVFYATLASAQSPHRTVRVIAQVTLVGPPENKQLFSGIRTGRRNAVTFTGNVNPTDAGATVVLQRQNEVRGRGWHPIGHTIVNSSGGFAMTHVFRVPGASEIRVMVRSNRRNIASASNTLSYDISQAQNPSLTIFSSADPIPYGGSAVISGVVAGAPHAPVTLLGRTAHSKLQTARHREHRRRRQVRVPEPRPASRAPSTGCRARAALGGALRGRQIRPRAAPWTDQRPVRRSR